MDLVKFRQSLTSPLVGPALLPLDVEKEPNGEDLLRLVDEVTRDDEPSGKGQRKASVASYNNGSGSFSAGSSLAHSSHIFAPPTHPPGRIVRGNSPPAFNGSTSERPKQEGFHSDSPAAANGIGPQFPRLDDRLMQPPYSPPPPHGAPPPSFETTIAQMREGHGTSPMLHGVPAPLGGPARVPETLIVRNDHGVFLLHPLHPSGAVSAHGVSPIVRSVPGGSPPSYGALHMPPPPYAESPALSHMLPPPYALTQSPVPHNMREDAPPPPPYELTQSPSLRPVGD